MDTLWKRLSESPNIKTEEVAREAFESFVEAWELQGQPSLEDLQDIDLLSSFQPHTPLTALEMLFPYVEKRRELLSSITILECEQPFHISITPSITYVGKLDKVYEDKDGLVYGVDHKTTSLYAKNGPFRTSFTESFSPNSQIDGYQFYLLKKYKERARYMWIDAALVHKTVHDGFRRIPVYRIDAQLEAWFWETQNYITSLKVDEELEEEPAAPSSETVMKSFPRNTSSCFDYNQPCTYRDICIATANPSFISEPPQGFEIDEDIHELYQDQENKK